MNTKEKDIYSFIMSKNNNKNLRTMSSTEPCYMRLRTVPLRYDTLDITISVLRFVSVKGNASFTFLQSRVEELH